MTKIAIVGTGNIARTQYVPALVKHEDMTLCYYNRSTAKAEVLAREHGGVVASSVAELMAHDPDAVLVLTRETDRDEATQALLAHRPRRLFFEKPLVARNGQDNVCEDDFVDAKHLLDRS